MIKKRPTSTPQWIRLESYFFGQNFGKMPYIVVILNESYLAFVSEKYVKAFF